MSFINLENSKTKKKFNTFVPIQNNKEMFTTDKCNF